MQLWLKGEPKSSKPTADRNWKAISKRFLAHAQNKPQCGAILVLADADRDGPVSLARKLTKRCAQIDLNCPVQIVCANREYESWFLASLNTIRGRHGLPMNAVLSGDAEAVLNPKQWLTDHMPSGQAYKETTHQASFSRLIDLDLACRNSRSFRRLCHALEQLLSTINTHSAQPTTHG